MSDEVKGIGRGYVVACWHLSAVTQHGVWWFGQLLTADDLQDELLLGTRRKRVVAEWVE